MKNKLNRESQSCKVCGGVLVGLVWGFGLLVFFFKALEMNLFLEGVVGRPHWAWG